MDTQANITLSALNGKHCPSERVLNLNPDRNVVQIGRASKNSSKGLVGALDNGWFDSPVMSRNHAEISLNLTNNAITIEDIGSMHGTFLNNEQLSPKVPQRLDDGDIIVFGAEVKRAEEIFPACAFQVTYDLLPYKATKPNTFSLDYIEDEEDCEFSDDLDGNGGQTSEDDTPIENQPIKVSQSINAIDLTKDDPPAAEPPAATCFIRSFDSARETGYVASQDVNMSDSTNIIINSGNAPIFVDSDSEDNEASSDSESSDDSKDDIVSIAYGLSLSSDYDSDEAEDSEGSEAFIVNAPPMTANNGSSFPQEEKNGAENASKSEIHIYEDHESHAATAKRVDDVDDQISGCADVDYDEESDFGLSEAARDGLQRLRDDGLLDKPDDSAKVVKPHATLNVLSLPSPFVFGQNITQQDDGHSWDKTPPVDISSHHFSQPYLNEPEGRIINLRQPSPSDAAMVKPTVPSSHFGVNISHLPSEQWQQQVQQTLGEKTGKRDFFEARAHNKGVFLDMEAESVSLFAHPKPTIAPLESPYEDLNRQRAMKSAANKHDERQRSIFGEPTPADVAARSIDSTKLREGISGVLDLTATTPQFQSLLDENSQTLSERNMVPELDMTSAVKFNESKASIAAANKTAAIFLGSRSRVGITDLIDDSGVGGYHTPPTSFYNAPTVGASDTPKTLKRKVDEISDVDRTESIEPESTPTRDILLALTDKAEPESQAAATEESDRTESTSNNQDEVRPVKKIRRFVERLGYAAIGGVAVGAGLFSALVITAPEFI